jgi:hypothetical protein
MRNYAKASPKFWDQGSGRRLRGDTLAQLVAQYLISAPGSNMLGLYYVGIPVIAHHIGSPLGGASEALRRACQGGFCAFDSAQDLVWVFNAAEIEFGQSLKPNDNNISSIEKLLKSFGNHPFVKAFLHRYAKAYRLDIGLEASPLEGPWEPLPSPSGGGPAKEHRAKNRNKEQEQEQVNTFSLAIEKLETALTAPPSAPAVVREGRSPEQSERSKAVNRRYRERYEGREGHPPTGTDKAFNGMIAKFADKHADNAMAILDWFFDSPDPKFKNCGWKVEVLIAEAPRLWREVNDKHKALDAMAAPAQARQMSIGANNELAYEEYKRRKEARNGAQ